jgi:hypothetical protein
MGSLDARGSAGLRRDLNPRRRRSTVAHQEPARHCAPVEGDSEYTKNTYKISQREKYILEIACKKGSRDIFVGLQ